MKVIVVLLVGLFIGGCASAPSSYVTLPWECTSSMAPQDAEVLRMEGNMYVYNCGFNGDSAGGAGDGEGDGDGDGE